MAPKKRTTSASPTTTTTTTTPITNAQLKALIIQGVADALAAHDANRSKNGDDNHNLGTGVRRQAPLACECTYLDFMKYKPLYFKGTEGVVELTQWFERMETVFHISNCTMKNQIKFATCTLLGSALMWMFPEESDKIEKYVGGLPDMIHGSVMASKLKTMQDAIEFETELMDKKISTFAERQAENNRKLDNNNQAQQQPPKKQGMASYTAGLIKEGSNSQLNDKGLCSRHMTGNIAHLSDFKDFDGGYVTFGGGSYGGRITGKGTIKTDNLDFDDVYFVKELKFNLFSVSQMCDKKNYVLFTDSECLVLSPNFKLPDENQILLKIPRQDNMYSFDMKNIVPKDSLTCLVAKATSEESMLWHRRLGHINFKNINKLVKENLVRDLPLKRFENDQTCVACLKGKQHRASCKTKAFNPITKPLFMLHMDLFGLTFVSSLMHKKYCLVVTDDYSRFSWVFFLTTKDETSEILKIFIKEVENLVDKKVKIIRSDNGTEFKNKVMDDFCREKRIKRVYSVARTPQQNGIAERKNRTLIEAARTMLADSKLPTTFWAEAVFIACYVQNRVLIVKPHNKTPYELFRDQDNQDCIVMPIWTDASYFSDVAPRSVVDAQIQDKDGLHDDSSLKDNGTVVQQVNTARPEINTGSREVSIAVPEVNTAT
ncbi:putative ribonuclease H-like domain-containing protein, partial [Tanacetum coccineum]